MRRAAPRTVYAELIRVRSRLALPAGLEERQPAYLARYWFFYYVDDWQWVWRGRVFTQAHEGDWEGITIGLDASRTKGLWAAYNQHCGGSWRLWEKIPRRDTTHAIVYVGRGSHASYFTAKPRATYPLQCLHKFTSKSVVDRVVHKLKGFVEEAAGVVDNTAGPYHELRPQDVARGSAKLVDLSGMHQDWKAFDGIWGEDQYLYLGVRPGPLNAGVKTSPKTPKFGSADVDDFWHDSGT